MKIQSKAPLRLGLAGGGTDVSPYSNIYGGSILNATIDLYAYATIIPRKDGKIVFNLEDKCKRFEYEQMPELPIEKGDTDVLLKAIYNRLVKEFIHKSLSFELTTYVDAPAGSGLGTSSTFIVAVLGAFLEWLYLPLGEYDIAHLAYQIEREDLGMAGGKQDQYAATFGGFNFMEFFAEDKVIINPLRVKSKVLNELARSIVLYNTETSRMSSEIIETQQRNVEGNNRQSIEAMHKLKEQSFMMKEAILKEKLDDIGKILNWGWEYKKQMAGGISTPFFEEIYDIAMKAGSTGGKISGAGGGGFIFFYCPGITRYKVVNAINAFGGSTKRYEFTQHGLQTWTIH